MPELRKKETAAAKVGREPVVRAGLKLLNEVGIDGLTLRAIATEIGVQAPTLYWRFKNKQDLIDEMATHVLSEWVVNLLAEFAVSAAWQERTFLFGKTLRIALLRYRDGARMVAGSYFTDTALYEAMEKVFESFSKAKISTDDAARCLHTIYSFVVGFTIEEQAVLSPRGERDPRYEASAREARIDASRYPLTRSAGAAFFENYDARFEDSLRMIISGFSAGRKKATAR